MSRKRQKRTLILMGNKSSPAKLSSLLTSKLNHNNLLHSDKSTYFYKYSKLGLVLPALALLVVLGYMTNPIGITNHNTIAYAEATDDDKTTNSMARTTSGVSLSLNTELPEDGTITKQVTSGGTKYLTVDFTVGAHDVENYQVYVQATSKALTGNTYNDVINSINTTSSTIGAKEWGYTVEEGSVTDFSGKSFQAIQTGVSVPAVKNEASSGSKLNIDQAYTLAFAANLDGAKADHYRSSITLSVASGAEETVTRDSFIGFTDPDTGKTYTYMQDITKDMCSNSKITTGTEWQLRDKRDEKIYWVAKLNDGLCWMTQNLDLDLTAEGLATELSDITKDWNQNSTTVPKPVATIKSDTSNGWNTQVDGWSNSSTSVQSYDPGVYTLSHNTVNGNVASIPYDSQEQLPVDILTNEVWLTLEEVGLDSSWTVTWDPTFVELKEYDALNGAKICTKEAGSMVGESTYIPCRIYYAQYLTANVYYNTHHAIGNYYSFNAATAGSGKNQATNNQNAVDSICPRGWKLPLSGTNNSLSSSAALGSYGLLLNKQSITSSAVGSTAIKSRPLYLTNSGIIDSATILYVGEQGRYWSSTVSSDSGAYRLGFTDTGVNPASSYNLDRYIGQTVRCVAR